MFTVSSYLGIYWWTLRSLPCLGYCKQHCNEYSGARILLNHVFLWIYAQKQDFWLICSSIFSILRNLHTVVHSGCTSLHSHQQCRRVPFSLHPLWHLLLVDFLNDGHSNWCEVILLVVLTCISLIINHVEHLDMSWPSVCLL